MSYNHELFDKVLIRIDNDPDSFNMGQWLRRKNCGTVGCFAGHTVLELGYQPLWSRSSRYTSTCERDSELGTVVNDVSIIAGEALGLTVQEGHVLFRAFVDELEDPESEVDRLATREDVVRRWKEITS